MAKWYGSCQPLFLRLQAAQLDSLRQLTEQCAIRMQPMHLVYPRAPPRWQPLVPLPCSLPSSHLFGILCLVVVVQLLINAIVVGHPAHLVQSLLADLLAAGEGVCHTTGTAYCDSEQATETR